MTTTLAAPTLDDRIQTSLNAPADLAVRAFAAHLGEAVGALAVLFYGSNLRTGSLDGRSLRALQHKMRLNNQSPCRVEAQEIDISVVTDLWETLLRKNS